MSQSVKEESVSIDNLERLPLTPATQNVNVADACDARSRANNAERELSITRTKLTREIRKNRRLQQQNYEYMEWLGRAVQDCSVMRHHFDLVSSSHLTLSQELQKAKVMVATLEAVIRMLSTSSFERSGGSDVMASGEQPAADKRD
ncbi:hypothetical protein DL95DRAFT_470817 [Leptodontidium sp. 2 PMI_412]|nr:hypothetical protein DL95DRAFT_470817 [Leptodontidium sp. 2 PMI_412]